MTLYDWAKSCAFLKSPCHEDSEKVYHVYGGQKFARLAVREVWRGGGSNEENENWRRGLSYNGIRNGFILKKTPQNYWHATSRLCG